MRALFELHAAKNGSFALTFQYNLSVPSARVKQYKATGPSRMGPICCPGTSVWNYSSVLHKIQKECRPVTLWSNPAIMPGITFYRAHSCIPHYQQTDNITEHQHAWEVEAASRVQVGEDPPIHEIHLQWLLHSWAVYGPCERWIAWLGLLSVDACISSVSANIPCELNCWWCIWAYVSTVLAACSVD